MQATFDPETGLYSAGDLAVSTKLPQNLLGTAYLRFAAEHTLETIYYEGVPSLLYFLQTCTAAEHICLGAFVDRSKSGNPKKPNGYDFVGMAWVFHQETMTNHMRKAEAGFAFFRHAASPSEKIALGKMMVEALFGAYAIDVLFGSTPSENRAALRYAQAVGFNVGGEIPNAVCWEGALASVCVSSLLKADWIASQHLDPDVTLASRETSPEAQLSIAPSNGYGLLKLCESGSAELVEVA